MTNRMMNYLINSAALPVNCNMLNLQKYFGQNFLIDNNIIKKIINASQIEKNNTVVEIGPGKGALTFELLKLTDNLILIEADKILADEISVVDEISKSPGIRIFNADAVKFDYQQLSLTEKNTIVISNLPYSCASQIIIKMTEIYSSIKHCVFMIQKEMADRIIAVKNTKEYGAFNVFLDCFFETKKMFDVSPNCFNPKPRVVSSVIKMTAREKPLIKISEKDSFNIFLHSAFANKRKTLVNSLVNNFSVDKAEILRILIEMKIAENIRAEQLDLPEFIDIFARIKI